MAFQDEGFNEAGGCYLMTTEHVTPNILLWHKDLEVKATEKDANPKTTLLSPFLFPSQH